MTVKNDDNHEISTGSAIGQMDRMVPKLCTNIQVTLLNEKHIVLSMIYADNMQSAALIERVTIDIDHAKGLVEILSKIIEGGKP